MFLRPRLRTTTAPCRETLISEAGGLLDWLRGIAVGGLLHYRAVTTPSPSHRAAVSSYGHRYHNKGYATYLADCQRQFAEQWDGVVRCGRMACVVDSIIEKPRTSKLTDPSGDWDNYAKGPCDALKHAGMIKDDVKIIRGGSAKRFAAPGEKPGVHLWIGEIA